MIVLVTGGRGYESREAVFSALDSVNSQVAVELIIHGMCPTGADKWADEWAIENEVPVIRKPPNWNTHGRKAGPMRNKRMAELAKEMSMFGGKLCVAFPGGLGTANMVNECIAAGIEVREVE